ncbi:unnamed protein product [Protopolystoma xenopodis]|uniref:Uncharacterized protein n=1 Tax=Protopolystoma xenopodis TaxID=117903 RepID=A0A3S5B4U8_9PLAT|nr:unnamed protein product [Protopolystoma xenopodis]
MHTKNNNRRHKHANMCTRARETNYMHPMACGCDFFASKSLAASQAVLAWQASICRLPFNGMPELAKLHRLSDPLGQ